jgi:hypothetical protein
MERAVFHRRTSIVARLASRSVTGRGLAVQQHMHDYTDIHLVWRGMDEGELEDYVHVDCRRHTAYLCCDGEVVTRPD